MKPAQTHKTAPSRPDRPESARKPAPRPKRPVMGFVADVGTAYKSFFSRRRSASPGVSHTATVAQHNDGPMFDGATPKRGMQA